MKYKKLILAIAAFFLVVNTSYFWESQLGFFAMLVFFVLVLAYLALVVALFRMLFVSFKEKFKDWQRVVVTAGLLVMLVVTFFKPAGVIDFDQLSGEDLLVAGNEGPANCTTTLKLKEHGIFVEKTICFGVDDVKGLYSIKNDTIFFRNDGRNKDYYTYAILKRDGSKSRIIVLYNGANDTIGHSLYIVKNELIKLK